MKIKQFQIGLIVLWLLFPLVGVAQTTHADSVKTAKAELKEFLKERESGLVALDNGQPCNCDPKDWDFFYETYRPLIHGDEELNSMRKKIEELDVKIVEKKESISEKEENQKKQTQFQADLEGIHQKYKDLMRQYQALDQLKRNARSDTLEKIQNSEREIFAKYQFLIDQNKDYTAQPPVDTVCKYIEKSHREISDAPKIEKIKWGDIIFKVTLVVALLFFVINLIVSKKKLKNQMNGKSKNKKSIPTI